MSLGAVAVLLAACGSGGSSSGSSGSSSSAGSSDAIQTANANGQTVLVNRAGKTLYSLSAETNGRFICANQACLSLWKPLTVTGAKAPSSSVSSLSTVKRPDGKFQVTFKGRPLYTFVQDSPGQTKGEGFRDVGVWHAAMASGSSSSSSGSGGSSTSSGSGGGGGGGYGY